jgi:hypothetical protein
VATGDTSDFVRRLRAVLPARWFPASAPVLTGVLTGFASVWASLYTLLIYVIRQSRIATATGVFLDMIALDFFQGRISRNKSEPDTHFRLRILTEILRPRATRAAVSQALTDLTGIRPIIFEPADTTDTGGYNRGGVGYNVAGGWGDLDLPFQAFITAFRPSGGGISGVSGYGNIGLGITTTGGLGGYGQGTIEWANLEMIQGGITDADIYATVAAAMPVASIGWTRGLAAVAQAQVQQTLQPVSGFTRSVSSARGLVSVVAGALLFAAGKASGIGRSVYGGATSVLTATGSAVGRGTLVGQSGILSARGFAALRGALTPPTGSGILRSGSLGVGAGRLAAFVGTLPLVARGLSQGTGRQLYGAVVAMAGRGITLSRGVTAVGVVTALRAIGKASGRGAGVAVLSGGASPVVRGTARATGRFALASLAANMTARGRAGSKGRGGLSTQQAAPTAPTNLTASNATPNTMTLTWSPSTGAP